MNVGTDSYTLKMLDAITGPLRRVESQMERVSGLMERMQGMAGGGGGSGGGLFGGMTKGTLALGAGIGVAALALKGLVDLMVSAVSVAGNLSMAFGKAVIQASLFRTQNITALSTFFGSKQVGEGVFGQALKLGGITPADERDVVAQVRELASAGYTGMGLSRANAALLDVGAIMGKEEQDNLRYYFRKLYGGRKVEADDMRMASFSAGLTENETMSRILKNAGITPNTDAMKMGAQFDALKKSGGVNGQAVLQALMEGISDKLDEGGPLGSAAKKMGMGTLSGLISNLEAAPMRFLAEMKLEDMPGIKSLMEFMKRLLPFFDHATEQGKRLAAVVERFTNALFGGLDRIGSQDLERFFMKAVSAAEQLVSMVQRAWDLIDQLLHGDTSGLFASFGDALIEVGKFIGIGLWEGVKLAMGGKTARMEDERDRMRRLGMTEEQINAGINYQFGNDLRGGVLTRRVQADFGGAPLRMASGKDIADAAAAQVAPSVAAPASGGAIRSLGGEVVDQFAIGVRDRAKQLSDGNGEHYDEMLKNFRQGGARLGATP